MRATAKTRRVSRAARAAPLPASTSVLPSRSPRTPPELRAARTCYDHLAGRLGVALYDALFAAGWLAHADGAEVTLTRAGERALAALGVDAGAARACKRRFAYGCLDWSERRPHLAGALGAALAQALLQRGWVARVPGSRAVRVTRAGARELARRFGVTP